MLNPYRDSTKPTLPERGRFKQLFINMFSNYRFIRRWAGGSWERWFNDLCVAYVWYEVDRTEDLERPGVCFGGGPVGWEDYPRKELPWTYKTSAPESTTSQP